VFVQQCFDEVERVYDDTPGREKKLSREDWAHGSLLITIELLRCSNVAAEVSTSHIYVVSNGTVRIYCYDYCCVL